MENTLLSYTYTIPQLKNKFGSIPLILYTTREGGLFKRVLTYRGYAFIK